MEKIFFLAIKVQQKRYFLAKKKEQTTKIVKGVNINATYKSDTADFSCTFRLFLTAVNPLTSV